MINSMDIDPGAILRWFRYRKVAKNRKTAEAVLLELSALTVTIHGRRMLTQVYSDEESGIPDEIRHIYWALLTMAPVEVYARWN